MARSCRLALLGLALSTLGVIRARADEPPPPVRLVYRAPAECPTREEFEARVLARTGKDGLYPEGGAPFELFEIDLTPAPERTRGRLTTYLRGAYPTVREIQAASCREAVDGLALIVALTLDPTTASKPTSETGASGASGRAAGSGGAGSAGAQGRASGGQSERGARGTEGENAEGDEQESSEGEQQNDAEEPEEAATGIGSSGGPRRVHFDVLFAGGAAKGITPDWLPEGSVSLGVVFPFLDDPGLMLRLGGRYAPDQTTVTDQGDATFELWTVHGALCPQVIELSMLWIAPCLNVEYGQVNASGNRTLNRAESTRDWFALGPKLIGQLSFLPPLYAHVGGELDFPLLRDRYVLGPLEVHSTPVLIGRLELGLGVRL
jgi:hypothetical protein